MKFIWMDFSALPKGALFMAEDDKVYAKRLDDIGTRTAQNMYWNYLVPASTYNAPLYGYVRIQQGE